MRNTLRAVPVLIPDPVSVAAKQKPRQHRPTWLRKHHK